jgi:hypothetical protein
MTRTLVLIAFAGFVLAVACIAGAIALGGSALAHHHWGRHWVVDWDDHHGDWSGAKAGGSSDSSAATREIAWPGGDKIEFDVPGDVQYTQAAGPAKLVITGPKDELDHIELSDGRLKLDDDDDDFDGRIGVVMTAPDVRHFAIDGDNSLAIHGYDQDDLSVDVSGHGTVNAKGRTRALSLDISGDGAVDMSGLAAQSAQTDISGSGRASIAPSDQANLDISGSGEIDLLTRPARVNSDVSGSGRIVEGAGPAASPTPAPPPAPKRPS